MSKKMLYVRSKDYWGYDASDFDSSMNFYTYTWGLFSGPGRTHGANSTSWISYSQESVSLLSRVNGPP